MTLDLLELENVGKMLGGDGYDRMEYRRKFEFVACSAWGREGWDLGDWPYVVVSARKTADGYELLVDVEGDLTLTTHDSGDDLHAKIDEIAVFYWRHSRREGLFEDLPAEGPVPEKYRGPYRSAFRAEARS